MKIKTILAASTFLLFSAAAFAGSRANLEMTVSDSVMYGALGDVHHSSDNSQRMSLIDRGTNVLVFGCSADGTCKVCTTEEPAKIEQLRAANSDAYVNVGFNEGVCGNVLVMNTTTFGNK
ncbi:hypothetical protein P886_1328 [Alteromonadaceae bacterium 2753L.S.0a.02]|nr:hypothetical protein P886_1328 [Alteromonadaceae bacterium 2753L.S.0a.02]